jgi:hypothetical protein
LPEIASQHANPDVFGPQASLVLSRPDSSIVATRPYPEGAQVDRWYAHGGWIEKFSVPADGQTGNYLLSVVRTGDAQESLFTMFLTQNSLGRAMFGGAADGISPGGRYPLHKRYWFHVPPGIGNLAFEFFLHAYCYEFPVVVFDPDGEVVYEADLGRLPTCRKGTNYWWTVPLTVTPSMQNRFWSIDLGIPTSDRKARETRPFRLIGIPSYFGESAASSFVPTP